jgi:sulfur carrier protein
VTITLNGQPHEAAVNSTVAELLTAMQIAVKHVAVEVNLELVPRSRQAEYRLQNGDRVEIVTLVGGG